MAAYAALLSLAQTTDLSTYEDAYIFSTDAKEKIRSIHEYVASLMWFLQNYPQKGKRLEPKITEVAHETEDTIENFIRWSIELLQRRTISPHVRSEKQLQNRFEEQLENAKEKIGLIAGEITEDRPAAISSSPSRLPSTAEVNAVIGLDDDLMKLMERLCEESFNLKVIPILGMGGIGKTTLARTVYQHPLIIERFEIRAWVMVSQDYCPRTFWRTLLGLVDKMTVFKEQMCGDEIDESIIALEVFRTLKGRRYLVVMDDVWGTQVCDDVRNIFPDDNNGSRIVLTTRESDVATYADPSSHVHEMRVMNDSQSWDLLKGKVFTNRNCPPDLEDIGKEIARRCSGLPLAVVLVAGVLSQVDGTRASWMEIAETIHPDVNPEIEEILSLSYTNLPHHLRPCFLFIGGFPSDINIHASRLIKLWVAEAFLKHQNECGKSLEERGEEYLEDLAQRNLVIVNTRKSNGKIKSCSLHDMVRGMCKQKAREEKFLHVMDGQEGLINEQRMCFAHSYLDYIFCPTVRTIICFKNRNFPNWLAMWVKNGRLLRVLDALGAYLKELPSEVFELYHLRYLTLTGSFNIPSAISNLVNLQTLIINQASGKLQKKYKKDASHILPLEIWRMPQLRHLIFYAPYRQHDPPDGLNPSLENLQTLSLVIDLVWNENIIRMIPNVKTLELVYETNQEFNLHCLKDLNQLEKLEVTGYHSFSWRMQNPNFPCALKKLTLKGGGFPWENMGIIGSLPNLQVLKLQDYACVGEMWETADGEFPQLRFLLIYKSDLQQWITQSSHFPTLKCLVLRSCEHLMEIQEDIGEIPTLELIELDQRCGISLVESAKKIQVDQASLGNHLQVRIIHSDEEMEATTKDGNGTETGNKIVTNVGGQSGQPRQTISYMAERVVGHGSFGVVFQAKCLENGETVAIKKVLQDKRYKNRELQTMRLLDHPNVVALKHYFYSTTEDELFLNLVFDYVPETIHSVIKHYREMNQRLPLIYVKLYAYQIFRALSYIHCGIGVCHRDIKPQNLLVDPHTHQVKLCDFGSAKVLVKGEPNISYICSRYYRAPELIFGATKYTTSIDIWSAGCVLAELLLGKPLFTGENSVDQLVEIIKVLGTPTREEIKCMNPNHTELKLPQIMAHPWHMVFHKGMPPEAVGLVSRLLQYSPNMRCSALEAMVHPFFDELRDPNTRLPDGQFLPMLFNFKSQELKGLPVETLTWLIPEHARKQ